MFSETNEDAPKKQNINKKHKILAGTLVIIGLVFFAGGLLVLVQNLATDSEGYVYSNSYPVNTTTYGFTLYMNEYTISTWGFLGVENVAQMKFIVKNLDPTKEIFTGIATTADSDSYRRSFQTEIPTYWKWSAKPYHAEIRINTTTLEGTDAPASLPGTQPFWQATASSSTSAEMTYLPRHEQHIWFIMNSDGSPTINAEIQIAFKSPILTILPFILLPLGILLTAGGFFLLRQKKT